MPTPPLALVQDVVRPPLETPNQHCRNALQLVRVSMLYGEFMHANDGPAVVVELAVLAAIQRRLETAIEQLEGPPR